MKIKNLIGAAMLSLSMVGLLACSSTPKPTSELAVSKTAIDSAVSAGGAEFAAVELKTAQDKFDQAQKALDNDDNLKARRLATEAAADAKLAEAKALTGKVEKTLQETQQAQGALKEEMQRQDNP